MASLNGQTIASSYEQLLHVDRDGGGNSTTLVDVKDGDNGTTFALKLATDKIQVNGSSDLDGAVTINESSAAVDFRVESDDNTHMIFVDGSEDLVGIGTQYPIRPLSVSYGAAKTSTSTAYAMAIQSNESANQAALQFYAVGGASAAVRKFQLQTTEQGVANAGIIQFQPDGGNVNFANNVGMGSGNTSPIDLLDLRTDPGGTGQPGAATTGADANNAIRITSTGNAINEKVGIAFGGYTGYVHGGIYGVGTGQSNNTIGDITFDLRASDSDTTFTEVLRLKAGGSIIPASLGTLNTHYGDGAGDAIQSGGNYNTLIGHDAGGSITTGDANVMVGDAAGDAITIGVNNCAIGNDALTAEDVGNNSTALGNAALASQNSDSNNELTENTGVGYAAGYYNVTGTGNTSVGFYSMVGASGNSHSDNTALGAYSGTAITTGGNNVLIGYRAADAMTTGTDNVAIGKHAIGVSTDIDRAVAIGSAALSQSNITSNADGSVAVGYFALGNLTTGAYNTAIGYQAMVGHTTGHSNIAIGRDAMGDTDAGSTCSDSDDNIAIGYQCMGGAWNNAAKSEYNVAMGNYALDAQLNGANANTCIGYSSGSAIIGGSNSVLLGFHAGSSISSGSNNVMIGYQAGTDTVALTTGDNNICIGYNTRTSANSNTNSIVIGQSIDSASNQVSIGKAGNKIYNEFDTDNAWTQGSDVRLKKDIQDSTLGLDFVNDLRPVTYQWKSSNELPKDFAHYNEENNKTTGVTMTGLIAQEVKEAIDKSGVERFAGWAEDKDGVQQISKEMFVFPLIKAVQELTAKVEELETKLNNKES